MAKTPPTEIRSALERLRDQTALPAGTESLFDLVLELVEYVASREDLIHARERDLEPDSLARRILTGAETAGLEAVRSVLAGVAPSDLEAIEGVLLDLEQQHGAVLETPPSHRLLLDGAVLGDVGFVYNRKFREVLAIRAIIGGTGEPNLLPSLTARVDDLFAAGPPRYLWRLGPEFGIDRNIRHLIARGDDFIVRSLYRSRARRLAKTVPHWRELDNGEWLGENCDETRFARPIRHLLVRRENGGRTEYVLLWSSLANTPWEKIYRFYRNRSGKWASLVEVSGAKGATLRRKVEVAIFILALFTFRNLSTWSALAASHVRAQSAVSDTGIDVHRTVTLFEQRARTESLERFREMVSYFQELTGSQASLPGLEAHLEPPCYRLVFDEERTVPAMAAGRVMFVDAEGKEETGRTVVVFHGSGFSTVYSNLAALDGEIRLGAEITAGQSLGRSAAGAVGAAHIEGRLAKRYAEKGFEPTASEILAPEANYVLDPFAALVELDSLRSGDRSHAPDPAFFEPDLSDAEVFTLSGGPLPVDILFPTARETSLEYEETASFEALDADLGFAGVLGESEDLS